MKVERLYVHVDTAATGEALAGTGHGAESQVGRPQRRSDFRDRRQQRHRSHVFVVVDDHTSQFCEL